MFNLPNDLKRWFHGAAVDAIVFALLLTVGCRLMAQGYCTIDPNTGQQRCENTGGSGLGTGGWTSTPPAPSPQPPYWFDPAICQIDNGTGTFIEIDGDPSYILTCAHRIPQTAGGASQPVAVGQQLRGMSRYGHPIEATVVAIDNDADLAILKFNMTAQYPARISEVEPPQNSRLTFKGFAMGGPLRLFGATQAGYDSSPVAMAHGVAYGGTSGGPVLDDRGFVCGVLSGTGDGRIFYGRLPRIRRLIDIVRARLRGSRQPSAVSPQPSIYAQPQPAPSPQPPAPVLQPPAPSPQPPVTDIQIPPLEVPPQPANVAPPWVPPSTPVVATAAKWGLAKLLVAVGVPAGAAGIAAVGFYWIGKRVAVRKFRRVIAHHRTAGSATEKAAPPEDRVIVVDRPPTPQQIVPETRYVTVEGNAFAAAYGWACEQTARKYPGCTETLSTLDSLIRQKLNAH